jgi:rare lipoprotein A
VNRDNGRAVTVRITDRGPYVGGRSLDLSIGAFRRIESPSKGWARVCFHEA